MLTAKQIKEKYQITNQTLYNWRNSKKIKFERLPSGRIMYYDLIGDATPDKKCVFYARVSNTKQKDDLVKQQQLLRQFMVANGKIVQEEFVDIASGMNESRPAFNKLLSKCIAGEISEIYVTYKDRLTRFGFGTIEAMLSKVGAKIIVINATTEEDFQQELTQDLVSIIHHFSMKLYSNRRKELKTVYNSLQEDINKYKDTDQKAN